MKKVFILFILIMSVCACSMSEDMGAIAPPQFHGIAGTITDEEGDPLERIKVTISTPSGETLSVYTSSNGHYLAEMDILPSQCSYIEIVIEDIDGPENGGQYKKISDRITIESDRKDRPVRLLADYRLDPATP